MFRSLVVGFFSPARGVRIGERLPIVVAFLIHLIAIVVGTLAIWWLINVEFTKGMMWKAVVQTVGEVRGVYRELARVDDDTTLIFAIVACATQLFPVLLAVLTRAWTACSPHAKESIGRAIKRAWLLTPGVAGCAFALFLVVACFQALYFVGWENWDSENYVDDVWFGAVLKLLGESGLNFIQGPAIALSVIGLGAALMWAIRGEEPASVCRYPPLCESCGYNVVGVPRAASCPECGQPVVDSLTPAKQEERRKASGYWWRPSFVARRQSLMQTSTRHRVFRLLAMPATLLLCIGGGLMVVFCRKLTNSNPPFTYIYSDWSYLEAVQMGSGLSFSVVFLVMLISCVTATVCGQLVGRKRAVNMLPIASRMASYYLPLLLAGVALVWIQIAMQAILEETGLEWRNVAANFTVGAVAHFMFGLLHLAVVLVYIVLVARAVRAARYLNF